MAFVVGGWVAASVGVHQLVIDDGRRLAQRGGDRPWRAEEDFGCKPCQVVEMAGCGGARGPDSER